MKIKFVFTFLLLVNYIVSQVDSSKAVVFIKPQDAIVYLDGKKFIPKQELIKLSVGYHKVTAWAPKYELFSDSFLVKKKENKFYSKKLRLNDNYRTYRAKKRLRVLTYTLPAILAGGFASMYYKGYKDYDKRISQTYNEAIEIEGLYNNSFSPYEFESNYNDYYQKVND